MPTSGAVALDRVLPASVGVVSGSRADAPDRPTPSGLSICRSPNVARPVAERKPQDRAQAGAHRDGLYGHRSAVPQTPYQPATSSASGVPVSAPPSGDHPVEPGLGGDITYIPMHRGFVYLCAVMDWASRRVLTWRLSNTLTTDFCLEAVQEALTRYGRPDIFNTDQGCQFTSQEFTGLLKDHGIQISMDGTGCWRDNVFVERLWRSVKYEEVYLRAYDGISAARQGVERYLTFYNQIRPHRALDGKTPEQVYCDNLTTRLTAA